MRRSILSIVLVVGVACGKPPTPTTVTFTTAGGTRAELHVEVADTPAERQKGLSGRASLAADSGMVFIYHAPSSDRFWMKDTLIPLSLAFVVNGRVVAITGMVPCAADPCRTYGSPSPYTAAIEAPAGWFGAHQVTVGAQVTIEGP